MWGSAIIFSYKSDPPELTENRMLEFVELVATAIANAESRTKLVASRARVVAASDETRRCIERNLHDGAQQRLVALGLELRSAQAALPGGQEEVKEQLSKMAHGLTSVIHELQEMSRGLHPAVLSRGVEPALKGLARRSAVPVELSMHIGRRLPERVEVAVYYTASEALNNVAKHAHATVARIHLAVEDMTLRLSIQDDGIGGADPRRGSGLIGLNDRIDALEGRIRVSSPVGAGTTLLVDIPLADG
jgi:signal transduction histidine kinase